MILPRLPAAAPLWNNGLRLALLAPLLLLAGCLMEPGKFTSSLDIRADRSFTFAYQGEIIVRDPGEAMSRALQEQDEAPSSDTDDSPAGNDRAPHRGVAYIPVSAEGGAAPSSAKTRRKAAPAPGDSDGDAALNAEREQRMEALAAALRKEQGYRSVRYLGGNRLLIDYAIHGTLDHSFLFPFNIDAQAVLPFVAVELRSDGRVRVRAPGFGDSDEATAAMMGDGESREPKERQGSFTLTTDAEIVSQNQEDGATTTPLGRTIVWAITPLTRIAPMAVLQFPTRR